MLPCKKVMGEKREGDKRKSAFLTFLPITFFPCTWQPLPMIPILRYFQSFPNQAINGGGGLLDEAGHIFRFVRRKMRQNIILCRHARRRSAEAQLHPEKFFGVQVGDDGEDAPVPPGAAALYELKAPEGHVQIIMHHH